MVARTVMGYRRVRRTGRAKRLGRKRRARRRLPLNLLGMRRRRVGRRVGMRRRRRVRRGGFLGKILSGINKVARSVPLVSAGLAATGNPMAAAAARSLGYGRRRRRTRRGGFMKGFMGALPLAINRGLGRRRTRRGGFRRVGPVSFGGYRQKSYTQFGGLRRVPRRPIIRPRIIRRSGMRRVRRGGNLMSILKRAHDFAKSHKLASRGISALGYGRRRRVGSRLRRRVGMRRRAVARRMRLGRRSRYLPNVSHF